ncbi:MAG: glycosyltransferase, partial [Sphingobacteriales bacterium]
MNQPEPYISIVIPTYNRAVFLRERLPRLLGLHYSAFEIIVVDDGSTDDTEEYINSIVSDKLRYYK